MLDKIGILNSALFKVGTSPINSLDGQSPNIIQAGREYDHILALLIQTYGWSSATKRFLLNFLVPDPADVQKLTRALLPAELLQIDHLEPNVRWYQVEGNTLVFPEISNPENTEIVLVYQESTQVGLFKPAFQEFFILKLATDICMPFTQNLALKADLKAETNIAFGIAASRDFFQKPNTPLQKATLIDAQFGGSGFSTGRGFTTSD